MEEDSPMEMTTIKREAPPAHYTFKIESFSQLKEFLSETGQENYKSYDFEVAGYKWNLSLYPDGDEKRNGIDHISLYLVLSESNNLSLGTEVITFFRLFAYDHIRGNYLMAQDASNKQTCFHAMKTECGFSQFIHHDTFTDASSGYLLNDCCIFGVEVSVMKCTGKGERLLIKKPQKVITHTMRNFSSLGDQKVKSIPIQIEGFKWSLSVFPNGIRETIGKYLSLYLEVDFDLCPEQKIWVNFKLRIENQAGDGTLSIKSIVVSKPRKAGKAGALGTCLN